jgi:hypothetical protein
MQEDFFWPITTQDGDRVGTCKYCGRPRGWGSRGYCSVSCSAKDNATFYIIFGIISLCAGVGIVFLILGIYGYRLREKDRRGLGDYEARKPASWDPQDRTTYSLTHRHRSRGTPKSSPNHRIKAIEQIISCPSCGKANSPSSEFCKYCFESLRDLS